MKPWREVRDSGSPHRHTSGTQYAMPLGVEGRAALGRVGEAAKQSAAVLADIEPAVETLDIRWKPVEGARLWRVKGPAKPSCVGSNPTVAS